MKLNDTIILRAVVSLLFYFVNVFAVYLLVRGHNQPGGGFIAGLSSALSFILLSLAVGVETAQRILRVDPVRIALVGLLIAIGSSMAPMLVGDAFLNQYNVKLGSVPLLGEVPVGTPLVFDIGVFLAVIGVTMKFIIVLARSLSGLIALDPAERRRYASRLESPIEESGPREDEAPPPEPESPGEPAASDPTDSTTSDTPPPASTDEGRARA